MLIMAKVNDEEDDEDISKSNCGLWILQIALKYLDI